MKKIAIILFVSLCAFSNAFCTESSHDVIYTTGRVVGHKFYPRSEYMYVDQKGIFINFEGTIYKASSLFSDEQGVYVNSALVDGWRCSKGHPNPPWEKECLSCGRSKGEI